MASGRSGFQSPVSGGCPAPTSRLVGEVESVGLFLTPKPKVKKATVRGHMAEGTKSDPITLWDGSFTAQAHSGTHAQSRRHWFFLRGPSSKGLCVATACVSEHSDARQTDQSHGTLMNHLRCRPGVGQLALPVSALQCKKHAWPFGWTGVSHRLCGLEHCCVDARCFWNGYDICFLYLFGDRNCLVIDPESRPEIGCDNENTDTGCLREKDPAQEKRNRWKRVKPAQTRRSRSPSSATTFSWRASGSAIDRQARAEASHIVAQTST